MKNQLNEDIYESRLAGHDQDDDQMLKALATLRARNERLIAVLGCIVDQIEQIPEELKKEIVLEQFKEDLKSAVDLLDELESKPL